MLEQPKPIEKPSLPSFRLGTLLLLLVITSLCVAWWADHFYSPTAKFDITGPITVKYEYRLNANSTPSKTIHGAVGIDFHNEQVVIYTNSGGIVIPTSKLIELSWVLE